MKVYILYGMLEGRWHGKRLRAQLRRDGFTVTRSLTQADAIIAHSGGCYMIPHDTSATYLLLVNLPYWPGKKIHKATSQKIAQEVKDFWWLRKTTHNVLNLFAKPKYWVRMGRNYRRVRIPTVHSSSIGLVRNEQDTYMHPQTYEDIGVPRDWRAFTIAGQHDDIWKNPAPYVRFLQELVKN